MTGRIEIPKPEATPPEVIEVVEQTWEWAVWMLNGVMPAQPEDQVKVARIDGFMQGFLMPDEYHHLKDRVSKRLPDFFRGGYAPPPHPQRTFQQMILVLRKMGAPV